MTPQVKVAHLGDPGRDGAREDRAVLPRAVRAHDCRTAASVDGATYTDVQGAAPRAQPADASSRSSAAGLFILNIFRAAGCFPIIAVGLWGFISIVVGTIYPALHPALRGASRTSYADGAALHRAQHHRDPGRVRARQTVQVQNVQLHTRTSRQSVVNAEPADHRQRAALGPRRDPVDLPDPQELQPYYRSPTSTSTATTSTARRPRCSSAPGSSTARACPSQSWVNQHLVYTHGYAAIVSPTNQASSSGDPLFNLANIPPVSNGIPLTGQGPTVLRRGPQRLHDRRHQGSPSSTTPGPTTPTPRTATTARAGSSCRTCCAGPRSRCASATSTSLYLGPGHLELASCS